MKSIFPYTPYVPRNIDTDTFLCRPWTGLPNAYFWWSDLNKLFFSLKDMAKTRGMFVSDFLIFVSFGV